MLITNSRLMTTPLFSRSIDAPRLPDPTFQTASLCLQRVVSYDASKSKGGGGVFFEPRLRSVFIFFRLNRSSERFGGHLLFARTLDDASNGAFGFRFALTISEKRLIVYKPDERRSAFRSRFGSRTAFRTRRRRRRVPISIRRRVICL